MQKLIYNIAILTQGMNEKPETKDNTIVQNPK